jgi:hypothetical protein
MPQVTKRPIPATSLLHAISMGAYFADSFTAALRDRSLTPAEISLRVSRATPPWAEALMSLRNRVVRLVGLKAVGGLGNVGSKPAATYTVGDRMGIFRIYAQTPDELVMGIDDRHLDVRVSVLKGPDNDPSTYVISTVVVVHNLLGHLYMLPVGRVHPLIVRAMMRRAVV